MAQLILLGANKAYDTAKQAAETVTGDFIIVDYSTKALAVFGDTKAVKDEINYLAAELRGIRTKKVVDNEFFYILSHDPEILHMPVS